MIYKNTVEGAFIERPNRFTARAVINGKEETVHVKNTGRCREILTKGARVILEKASNPERKTKYDLIAAFKGERLINIDSQVPNDAVAEWLPESGLFSENATIKREHRHGNSRFDFLINDNERKILIEVKGVTLEQNGTVSFPDAPTERGTKHLRELTTALSEGYEAIVIFVIQMNEVCKFTPNKITDPAFASALSEAAARGVRILALDCEVTENSIGIGNPVPIELY